MHDWRPVRYCAHLERAGVQFVRTPESRFAALANASWPFAPNYALIDGLRMHYIDEGPHASEDIILMLHGQPTWSYLYRRMVPTLVRAGLRVLCVDQMGMGRSDKPIDLTQHSYNLQIARLKAFILTVLPAESAAGRLNIFVQVACLCHMPMAPIHALMRAQASGFSPFAGLGVAHWSTCRSRSTNVVSARRLCQWRPTVRPQGHRQPLPLLPCR